MLHFCGKIQIMYKCCNIIYIKAFALIKEKSMSFHVIDVSTWERKEFYEHFINEVVCGFIQQYYGF